MIYLDEVNFGLPALCDADSVSCTLSNSAENSDTELRVSAAEDTGTNRLYKLCRICTPNQCCTFSNTAR